MMASEQLLHTMVERARTLARPRDDAGAGASIDVLLFRLKDDVYAVELPLLRRIQPAYGLIPVPCPSPAIAGLLNVQGEITGVLDLGAILGQPLPWSPDVQQVLLVDGGEEPVGLLVDEVLGVREIVKDDLDRSVVGQGVSLGVAEARFTLLDLVQLLADRQLIIDDIV